MSIFELPLKTIIMNIINKDIELYDSYNKNHPNKKYSLGLIIDEIIYVLKTGLAWRNIRSPIKWQTLYGHFRKLASHNVFNKLFHHLRQQYVKRVPIDTLVVDSTFVMNKYGHNKKSRNKFYKNKHGNKVSLVTDINGVPLSVIVNKGSVHDLSFMDRHITDIKPMIRRKKPHTMLADKGYESKQLRGNLIDYGIQLMIPKKKGSVSNYVYDKNVYKQRIIIENTFQRLKAFRRSAIRYDKIFSSFVAFTLLVMSILIYNCCV